MVAPIPMGPFLYLLGFDHGCCGGGFAFAQEAHHQEGSSFPGGGIGKGRNFLGSLGGEEMKWAQEKTKGENPRKMGFWEHLSVPAILAGVQTTVKHMLMPKVTVQYPEQKPKIPANYRGVHRLNRDEEGRVKCVA